MKKLLLSSAAIGLALASTPAIAADGVELNLGGYYKGYLFVQSQDDVLGAGNGEIRSIDALRQSEIHFSGETTLDNGLTVGAHIELESDYLDTAIQESYIYFSGGWGRVNFGAENSAAYLLQVAAPSADSNYDGIRQFVAPFNYAATVVGAALSGVDTDYDYEQDQTGYKEKVTYLSPILNGFQVGLSYTPEALANDQGYNGSFGANLDDEDNETGSAYEGALRYEGQFNGVGVTLGGGYSFIELEEDTTPAGANMNDDRTAWNIAGDLDIGAFGVGVAYMEDNQHDANTAGETDQETWVVGADYTTGPIKLGVSYLGRNEETGATTDIETQRYTGGLIYTYGPGMTFRGSLTRIVHDTPVGSSDIDGTALMLGTQINF